MPVVCIQAILATAITANRHNLKQLSVESSVPCGEADDPADPLPLAGVLGKRSADRCRQGQQQVALWLR